MTREELELVEVQLAAAILRDALMSEVLGDDDDQDQDQDDE